MGTIRRLVICTARVADSQEIGPLPDNRNMPGEHKLMKGLNFFAATALLSTILAIPPALANESHCEAGKGVARASTPTGEFELPRDGTIIHSRTGLQWAQCSLGQSWSRDFCTGQAQPFDWSAAREAIEQVNQSGELGGYRDWRLPTREELESIVEKCREAPSINENVFPNTPWAGYWTSSTNTSQATQAWFVGFYYGLALEYSRASSYRVRPVRDS